MTHAKDVCLGSSGEDDIKYVGDDGVEDDDTQYKIGFGDTRFVLNISYVDKQF